MCNENIFTYVYPDGQRVEQIKHDLCDLSRHGKPCKLTKTFEYPAEYVRPGQLSPPAYSFGQFPPTPPLSSHSASASDSEHSSKDRREVYINGEKVIDLNKRSSRRDRGDRAVYIEGSSLSRTPPRKYNIPRSSPSSPHDDAIPIYEPRHRERSPTKRERRTSSHSRPRSIEVKVVNDQRSNHRRHGSSKSSKSSKSSSHDGDDEERHRRRRNSHVRFEDDEKQKMIDRANEAIANRPPVPASQAPLSPRYRRGSVVVDRMDRPNTSLITAMDQLSIERGKLRRERQAAEQREREEEEAQKRRLRERMAPKRRATVSNGHGRARDDERIYWE
ncbi:hypothetical protein F4818DRAFT_34875 [Hypoxylon cercidicola]|nr:hypothetical protein F4818DRAFT_34875 [Hypoxylon cercidicola]